MLFSLFSPLRLNNSIIISVPRKYLPGVLSRSLHGLVVCTAQLVIGSVLVSLAIWRMVLQVTAAHSDLCHGDQREHNI